jgi:phage terminase large subunit-like protein
LQSKSEKQTLALYTDWLNTARPKQISPSEAYNVWLILAGRGWGKTRTGAQDIALYALRNPNSICAVVAPTFGDLRRVCFGGPSGLVAVIPDDCFLKLRGKKSYSSSISEIKLYNGSKITGFAAIDPERLRGPQFHRAWCDELAAWRYPEAFDQLMFGLRLGDNPQCLITTTPKPIPIIKELVGREDCVVTTGSTFENEENLAPSAIASLKERYEGTTLGRQELYAEILDDIEGSLWKLSLIDETRLEEAPPMKRIVVAIDPAVTSSADSDETGIVVAGLDDMGHFHILDDVSGKMPPDSWAKLAVQCYYKWEADRVIAEVNNGGDLVERVIRTFDTNIPYTAVTASRGKMIRAEPISALYEQRKVHHIGSFPELEDQMCSFIGQRKPSPDRLDAMVWALTHLSQTGGVAKWRIT